MVPVLMAAFARVASSHTFTPRSGYLPSGSDVPSLPPGSATLQEAKVKCAAVDACKGFTFEGKDAAPAGTIARVFFKARVDDFDPSGGWVSYLKDYSPPPPLLNNPCTNATSPQAKLPWCDPTLGVEARVADMVARMSISEKIAQLGTSAPPIPSLGLNAYNWWSEATHGEASGGHGARDTPTTNFPFPITTAMSFNRSLWRATGGAIGTETRAVMNLGRGYSTFWAPVINLAREPRWGRNIETPGEDPFLSGQYAIQFVQGMQRSDSDPGHLLSSACCKHFVANSMDSSTVDGTHHDREEFDADISAQDLVDSYMPPFQACVEEGGVSGLMCSYNAVNGVPSCASDWLLSTVARGEWGFDGYVTSDCDADNDVYFRHRYTDTAEESVAAVLRAGTDVDCGSFVPKYAPSALKKGAIGVDDLDARLANLFAVRMRLGHFDPAGPLQQIPPSAICSEAHQRLADDGAAQSATLLKNEGRALPLEPAASVAVIGPTAVPPASLAGYYGPGYDCGKLWDLVDAVARHSASAPAYAAGLSSVLSNDTSTIAAAAELGAKAERVVLALGTDLSWAREAHDADPVRGISLTAAQHELLSRVAAAAKRPVAVVMLTATPLDISKILANPKVGAVVHAGQPALGVRGVGDVLYGAISPAGRMVQTVYPESYATSVSIFDFNMRPGPSAWPAPGCDAQPCPNGTNPGRTYRFYTGTPVVPFGHGLSYTTFSYTLAATPPASLALGRVRSLLEQHAGRAFLPAEEAWVSGRRRPRDAATVPLVEYAVNVTNTGSIDADDVVLGFLVPPGHGAGGAPLRYLFGFERVHVRAGETVTVWLYPRLADLTLVGRDGARSSQPGEYTAEFGVHTTAAHGMGFVRHSFVAL